MVCTLIYTLKMNIDYFVQWYRIIKKSSFKKIVNQSFQVQNLLYALQAYILLWFFFIINPSIMYKLYFSEGNGVEEVQDT